MSKLVDAELERDLLGSCLAFPELITRLDVGEQDFVASGHRAIWSALVYLAAEGEQIDTVRLRARLADTGKLDAAGGLDYLLKLTEVLPLREPPTERLTRLTRLRGIEASARRVAAACAEADLDGAISALAGAHEAALQGARKTTTKDVLELCLPILDDLDREPDPRDLVHPGYEIMSRQLGLIPRQSSVGILADTNVGKSTMCLEILLRMASCDVHVGYLSVEDQERRTRVRIAGAITHVNAQDILQKRLEREDKERLVRGFERIERLKPYFHISTLQGGTDADVCAAMSELASRGCIAVAVDYLQKIRPATRGERKNIEMSEIATRITSHGQRLDLVTFLVSQCTRDKAKQNECPSKHDMKESGDLENMLDMIVGMWREYEDDYAPIWVRILKHKDGGVGRSWCVQRDRVTGRFEEVEGSDRMNPPDAKGEWSHRKGAR